MAKQVGNYSLHFSTLWGYINKRSLFTEIRWCVKGLDEIAKCTDLKTNVTAKNYPAEIINAVNCIVGRDNYECLEKIESDEADLVSLDAGTAYYASINFVSALLAAERYGPDGTGGKWPRTAVVMLVRRGYWVNLTFVSVVVFAILFHLSSLVHALLSFFDGCSWLLSTDRLGSGLHWLNFNKQ